MITYRQPFKGEYPITQGYGEKDTSSFHTGIDYACPIGTQILASADGVVMFAGLDQTGYGKTVIIQHNDGKSTLYAHLVGIGVYLRQKVQQGEVIGLSGNTGNSTGPHLHFEARRQWNNYKTHENPVTFLPLMTFADYTPSHTEQNNASEVLHPKVNGICKIACESAWVRDWETIERSYTLSMGDYVYVFDEMKEHDGLPYRFIGANRCIAEYDRYGTQILEKA